MDRFQEMQVFVAVADEQSFASAARRLNMSAPVLFGELFVTPLLVDYLDQFPQVQAKVPLVDMWSIWRKKISMWPYALETCPRTICTGLRSVQCASWELMLA